jgi:PAS domain S-box-containing protein
MAFDWRNVSQHLHFAACLAETALVSWLVFSPIGQPWMQPFWLLPVITWASLGFGWATQVSVMAITMLAALLGTNPYTSRVSDPFVAKLLLIQALTVGTGFGAALSFIISVKRRAAAKIAAQEAQLRDLLETVDLGVFMARELEGKILFWSKGAQRLYGWTAEEAVGRTSHDLLHTSWPIPLAEIDRIILEKGEWRGDLHHITKDGRPLIVRAHKVLRKRPDGSVIVLLEAITDVTEERRDQAALADLARTLEERVEMEVAVREQAQDRMKQAHHMQALGKISAGVAHEFNNILQAVSGSLECISAKPDDSGRVARLSRLALSASERGSIITSRLLAFSGRASYHPERTEPALVLDALRDVLGHTLGGRVTVCMDIEPALPALMVDKSEFETAMINLATNARDAMPEGGAITISARVDADPVGLTAGRYVLFAVKDHGVGMDQTTLRRSIEPFFTTKAIGSGTGLGLSMVKGFAEQSGGGINITSTPGEGTTVSIWLPATELGAVPLPQRPAAPAIVADTKAGTRVLLVDDEAMVREAISGGLEDAGFSVVTAEHGAAALALLEAGEAVDVLVSDYAMPGMDGMTLIREVQARRPGLPCLILTGYVESISGEPRDGRTVLNVLRKPIGARDLANSIGAVLTLVGNGQGRSN